jgi:formylglycine-generating enzyme required for sulfatase activity
MLAKVSVFAAIALLSVAAALWLAPPRPAPGELAQSTKRTVTQQANPKGSAQTPGPAGEGHVVAAVGGIEGSEARPGSNAPAESALSVAACPLGMVFVERQGFCIDRYEYPNLADVVPATLTSFDEAKKTCDAEGKRLCTDREWTEACLDLPAGVSEQDRYGAGRCNYGPPEGAASDQLGDPERVAATLATLDKRTKSGRMADCVSSSGVADLLGNVQEWVQSGNPSYEAAQKGGYFATEAPSCRESSNVRHHQSRQQGSGFRCCSGPLLRRRLLSVERQGPP